MAKRQLPDVREPKSINPCPLASGQPDRGECRCVSASCALRSMLTRRMTFITWSILTRPRVLVQLLRLVRGELPSLSQLPSLTSSMLAKIERAPPER